MDFDLFIGIDWSGAKSWPSRPARGVAMAICDKAGLVRPLAPANRDWWRYELIDWLAAEMARGQRILAGFDFAFSLPWAAGAGYLAGRVPDIADMMDVWELVEAASGDGLDGFAGAAIADPRLAPSFWLSGPMPAHWSAGEAKQRRIEIVAAATGAGTPVSVFKLAAASKQVGKASLAGMRALRRLRALAGDRLAFWPYAMPASGQSVALEIYPTLFRKQALGSTDKVVQRAVLEAALGFYGCHADAALPDRFDDHAGDAMISAAGLRRLAAMPTAWAPAGLDGGTARREGWIFGVGA